MKAAARILLLFSMAGCATMAELNITKVDDQAVARMSPLILTAYPHSKLDQQTKVLLTFLASTDISKLVRTPPARAGVKWDVESIVIVSPGSDVSVVCGEGPWGEVLHFSFRGHDSTWVLIGRHQDDCPPQGLPIVKCKLRRSPNKVSEPSVAPAPQVQH
jgi:hypothetical protein